MVEVVLAEVVLGEVGDVCSLHVRDVGGVEEPDIHRELRCGRLLSGGCGGAGGVKPIFLLFFFPPVLQGDQWD